MLFAVFAPWKCAPHVSRSIAKVYFLQLNICNYTIWLCGVEHNLLKWFHSKVWTQITHGFSCCHLREIVIFKNYRAHTRFIIVHYCFGVTSYETEEVCIATVKVTSSWGKILYCSERHPHRTETCRYREWETVCVTSQHLRNGGVRL